MSSQLISLKSIGPFNLGEHGVTSPCSNPVEFKGPFAPSRLHANKTNTINLDVIVYPPSKLGGTECMLKRLFPGRLGDGTLDLLNIDNGRLVTPDPAQAQFLNGEVRQLVDYTTSACKLCIFRAVDNCLRTASIILSD